MKANPRFVARLGVGLGVNRAVGKDWVAQGYLDLLEDSEGWRLNVAG
jgi:hypothetical protein